MEKYIVKNKDYQPISPTMDYESAYNYARQIGNGAFVDIYYENSVLAENLQRQNTYDGIID